MQSQRNQLRGSYFTAMWNKPPNIFASLFLYQLIPLEESTYTFVADSEAPPRTAETVELMLKSAAVNVLGKRICSYG